MNYFIGCAVTTLSFLLSAEVAAQAAPDSLATVPFSTRLPDDPSMPQDGRWATDALQGTVHMMIITRRFDQVDRLVQRYIEPQERFDDGRMKLQGAVAAFDLMFAGRHTDWNHEREFIAEWREARPRSSMAALAEAKLWTNWAWHARGSGFAASVTPEGWKLFHERLGKAQAVLEESKAWASLNPHWYVQYLVVLRGQNRSKQELLAAFREGSQRHPAYYPIYFSAIEGLRPRWGGSYEEIDALIEAAVASTQATEGTILYARLYWYLTQTEGTDFDLFEETPVSWKRLRASFDELIVKFPDSIWNPSNFAAFACRANDADAYLRMRMRLSSLMQADAFPDNLPIEVCELKLAQPI